MQIKQFYLDLKEGPQYAKKNRGNVWLLESEAFSEPLRFSFQFENEDLKPMEQIKDDCKKYYKDMIGREEKRNAILDSLLKKEKSITDGYQKIENLIDTYTNLLSEQKRKEDQINKKGLEDNKRIDEVEKEIKQIRKEISLPQPQKVYSNIWDEFVCGTDVYYGYDYKLPSGEYCILEQYEYEPQNEYVANENKILIKEQHINQRYIPEIQLFSTNAIDKPVSKVRLTVLFFQI